jgi:hypothetical protein|tara:strand:+ start:1868 stop:2131 length:264 start_codon:yes stop_codon:yes gene_type:complete
MTIFNLEDCDQEVIALKGNPETPYWVADVIEVALTKDPVDALLAFEKLAEVFDRRNQAILQVNRIDPFGVRMSDGLGIVESSTDTFL